MPKHNPSKFRPVSPKTDKEALPTANDSRIICNENQAYEAQNMTADPIVQQIYHGLSCATGEAFFKTLTQQLVKVLQMDFAFIGKFAESRPTSMQTLAVYGLGQHRENFTYNLANTPCSKVLIDGLCLYPENVYKHFPDDHMLLEMEIEGYFGTPLISADNHVLGIMVIMSQAPVTNVDLAKSLLQIFAVRASSELERQLSEQELIKSRKYYQSLFDCAGDTIFLVEDGVIIDCNSIGLKMFGGKRKQILGLSPVDLSPQIQPNGRTSKDCAEEKITAALGGNIQQFDWIHSRLDGTPFDAEVTLNRIELSGKMLMLGLVRDVSERKRVEKIVRQQDEQLHASIESLPGIFYMFDEHGKIVQYNNAYLEHRGETAEETENTHALEFLHPDDLPIARAAMRDVLATGKAMQLEVRSLSNHGLGPMVHLLATGSRTYLDGKPYLVGAAFNISERVAAETHLTKSQAALEERNQSLLLVNTLSTKLHELRSEKNIYTQAALSLGGLARSPFVLLGVHTNDGYPLQIVKTANIPKPLNFLDIKQPLEEGLAKVSLGLKPVQINDDIANDPRQTAAARIIKTELLGVKTEVCIPLLDHDKSLGVISLMYNTHHIFSDIELQTLASMANNIAFSITNARHTKRLQFQAQHDSLTGLYNRAALHNQMDKLLCKLKPKMQHIALILIDLDRFKEVNDTLGHDIGDQLICTIGPRIQQTLEQHNPFVSRLGGDEFAVLLDNIKDSSQVIAIVEQIKRAINTPMAIEGFTLDVSSSIGIALSSDDISGRDELLRRADVAMYNAKRTGLGYCLYEPQIDNHSREKLALMSELRSAIDHDEFVMHYQPKINLLDNQIIGFESLIRWQNPRLGLTFPDSFIPLMEMTELIHPLTELVIQKSIHQLLEWNQIFQKEYTIAVNISTRNLLDNNFPKRLESLVKTLGFNAHWLELEITESTLITDPKRTLENLNAISALGIKLSIDDFGTGYSSLAYLKQLPIQTLKIDRSFVMEMDTNKHDEMIVTSTISLAHNLGLNVIAEGVETELSLNKLAQLNCDCAQGYHIGRPVPAKELTSFIKSQK